MTKRHRDRYAQDGEYRERIKVQAREYAIRPESAESRRMHGRTVDGKARILLNNARRRAKAQGLPFDLTREWVAIELEKALRAGCPYLGIEIRLDCNANDGHSPSIDQFYPGAGYVQDNCLIVSHRGNRIKNDCPPGQIEKFAENVTRVGRTRFRDIHNRHVISD